MDKSHNSPQLSNHQSSFSGSAATNNNGGFGYVGMPPTHRQFELDGPSATEDEFIARAKAHKRSQLKNRLYKKLIIVAIILGLLILALGVAGFALNKKYTGRALPYSYIGNISVGGLTAAEIKAALDAKASQTTVTFTEAGLTREVPVSMFTAQFDTEKASQDALVGFNPFKFFLQRQFSVPVTVDANHVDGYLQLYVADKQTSSVSAQIVKNKEQLTIKPEVYGYRTSTAYVVEQLEDQLKEMKNPVVSLSAAVERPDITTDDLKDDLEKAQAMVATDAAVQVWSTKITPNTEEKLSWLDIEKVEGTNDMNIQFNQTKVREYIFGLAERYELEKEDDIIAVREDGSQYIKQGKNGQKIKNTDEVAAKFYQALVSQQSGLFSFEFDYTEYQKIDPSSVNLATATGGVRGEETAEEVPIVEDNQEEESDDNDANLEMLLELAED